MRLSIGEAARLLGVSVRTLHYYDEIGLASPSEVSDAGYRYYGDDALAVLQQVLFYRELELPLGEIKCMLQDPEYDRARALREHRELLLLKRRRLDELLRLVDETLGGNDMKKRPETTLADIENAKRTYAAEARQRWGGTAAYTESEAKHAGCSDDKELAVAREADGIFAAFAENMDRAPEDAQVQALVGRWRAHITENHYECTVPILACLGEMYVSDARFTENIDRFGDGTAQFMRDAIRVYCGQAQHADQAGAKK